MARNVVPTRRRSSKNRYGRRVWHLPPGRRKPLGRLLFQGRIQTIGVAVAIPFARRVPVEKKAFVGGREMEVVETVAVIDFSKPHISQAQTKCRLWSAREQRPVRQTCGAISDQLAGNKSPG